MMAENEVRLKRNFRKLLQKISKQLRDDNLQEMMNVVVGLDGFPGWQEVEKVKTGMDFFLRLEAHGKLSHDNFGELEELLKDVNRIDLVNELKKLNGPTSPVSPGTQQTPRSPPRNDQFTPPLTSTPAAAPILANRNPHNDIATVASIRGVNSTANEPPTNVESSDSLGYYSQDDQTENAKPSDNIEVQNNHPVAYNEGDNCVIIQHPDKPPDGKSWDFAAHVDISTLTTQVTQPEVTKHVLSQLTTVQLQNSHFLQHQTFLWKVYILLSKFGAQLTKLQEGSIKFTISFNSKENLETFWKAYKSGELQKELAKCLISNDLETHAGCNLGVTMKIDEDNYTQGMDALGSNLQGCQTCTNVDKGVPSSVGPAMQVAPPQIAPATNPASPITPHDPVTTTSQANRQDQSVRPKERHTPVSSKSSTELVHQQDLSVRPKEWKPASTEDSPNTQNQTQEIGQSQADEFLPSSSAHESHGGRPFLSLTSHPERYEPNQLHSILEKSDPDPSDLGGEILAPSAASTSVEPSATTVSSGTNDLHPPLHGSSDANKLVQKFDDLSLDAPVVDDVDASSGMASANDLETDAPDESFDDKTANLSKMSNVEEDRELVLPADNSGTSILSTSSLDASASSVGTGGSSEAELSGASVKDDTKSPDEQPVAGGKQLRAYQTELATPPMSGSNYIICAPTGSGKTLTAAAICHHFYKESVNKQSYFKALFIVNIRHLTQQQRHEFKERFPRGAVRTIGETELLKDVLFAEGVSVVMVTAQIVVNSLQKRGITLQDVSMIIFDECHHTTQNHPYNEIMRMYLKDKRLKVGLKRKVGESGDRLPHVIGLSASLGVGRGEAFDHVQTLCANMDAKDVLQVREHKEELDTHVNAPENDDIRWVSSRLADQRDLSQIIEGIMSQIEGGLWDEDAVTHEHGTQGYEHWVRERQQNAERAPDRDRYIASIYLFEYNKSLILYEDLRASDSLKYLQEFMQQRDLEQEHVPMEERCRALFEAELVEMKRICRVEENSPNPKLEELANLLREKFESNPESKGIVLTRMRLATIALIEFIRTTSILKGLQCPVRPTRLVGQGESDNYFMTESEQKMSLRKFRNDKECNLLVATDIAQEGLDMPACNFVIRFNFVSNEIGTVQSKGRARAKQSECYLIVEEESINAKREQGNRRKVIAMQEAMDKLNSLSKEDRLKKITEKQDKIYKVLDDKEKMAAAANRLLVRTSDTVDMLCKECNMYITNGAYMRKKGCHFTCKDPEVKKRITIVPYNKTDRYRDSETIGVFKCANPTCGQRLGIAVKFLKDGDFTLKGYGFSVKSFRFKFSETCKETYKQWKKVPLNIPDDED